MGSNGSKVDMPATVAEAAPLVLDACARGDMTIVKAAVNSLGISVVLGTADGDGNTPLHHGVRSGNSALINYLTKYSANWSQRNSAGLAPVHLACSTPAFPPSLLQTLLRSNINVRTAFNDVSVRCYR